MGVMDERGLVYGRIEYRNGFKHKPKRNMIQGGRINGDIISRDMTLEAVPLQLLPSTIVIVREYLGRTVTMAVCPQVPSGQLYNPLYPTRGLNQME